MPGILVPYYSDINEVFQSHIILRCAMGALMSTGIPHFIEATRSKQVTNSVSSQPIFLLDVVRHPMVKMAVTFLYQPGFLENLAKVFKTKQKKMINYKQTMFLRIQQGMLRYVH